MLIIAEQNGLSTAGRRAIARANQGSRVALTDLKTGNNAIKGNSTEDKPDILKPSLPSGVTVKGAKEGEGGTRTYTFTENETRVKFTSKKMLAGSSLISFSVGGSEYSKGKVSSKDGAEIVSKVSKIMKYEAATRPEGFRFSTSATKGDGLGQSRTAMYGRAGFSLPEKPGRSQYAVISKGKLVPSTANGTPYSATQMAKHKSDVREAVREGARARKALRESTRTRTA